MPEQVITSLVLDGEELLKGLAQMREGMIELAKASGLTQKQIDEAFDKAAINAKKYDKALDEAVRSNQQLVNSTKQLKTADKNYEATTKKVDALGRELDQAEKEANQFGAAAVKSSKQAKAGFDQVGTGSSKLAGLLKTGGALLGGFFAATTVVQFGQAVFAAGAQFQKFQAMLTTALGSQSEAKKALSELSDFAKKTPFELAELTESYIKFANRGVKLTRDELTKLGDLAASQGKSFLQLTEAILDAGTGEFERLKEFGIKASAAGDQVSLSFKNQTIEVKKSEEAIRAAIISMGAFEGVAGGMALQAETLGGQFSNLQDGMGQLAATIGQKLAPIFGAALAGFTALANGINDFVRTKSVEELNAAFNTQIDTFLQLESELTTMSTRYDELKGKTNLTTEEQKELNDITKELAKQVPTAVTAWDNYGNAIGISTNKIKEFIKQQGLLLQYTNKDEIKRVSKDLADAQKQADITRGQISGAQARLDTGKRATGQILSEKEIEQYQRFIAKLNEKLTGEIGLVTGAQGRLEQLNGDFIEKRRKQLEEQQKLEDAAKNKKGTIRSTDVIEKEIKALKKQQDEDIDNREAFLKIQAQIDAKEAEIEAIRGKKKAEVRAEESADNKKKAKDLKEKKELLDLEKELAIARAQLLQDEEAKATALENANSAGTIREFEFKKIGATDPQIAVINKLIEAEQIRHEQALTDIKANGIQKRVELALQIQEDLSATITDEREKELSEADQGLQAELRALANRYKGNNDLILGTTLAAIGRSQEKKREINKKYDLQDLDDEEKQAELIAELTIEKEEDRQIALLNIAILYAQKRKELLLASGVDAFDPKILELDKVIKSAGDNLKKATDSAPNLRDGIFKALGLGALNDQEKQLIEDSFNSTIGNVFQALTDGAQAQIEAKKQEVDALNDQIDEIEDALDREYRLREAGYANNALLREAELASLKEQRDKALKEQEAANKKQQNIQKAQILLDSAVQASNLITSATEIFKALSKIPGIGVPLAIGLIATMFGAFAASKAQALKLASVQKFEDGGAVGGKSHSQGGNKYRSMDDHSDIIEIERGEWITKKKQAKKFRPLLEAINNDELSTWSFTELAKYAGIPGSVNHQQQIENKSTHVENKSTTHQVENRNVNHQEVDNKKINRYHVESRVINHQHIESRSIPYDHAVLAPEVRKETKAAHAQIINNVQPLLGYDPKELKDINKGIQDLLAIEKARPEVTDMGDHIREKIGSITRRIKK
jgi:hypothetical protein